MLSPGSRVGVLLHLRRRRHGLHQRQQPDQPGPVRLRQPGRVRCHHRRGLRQRRRACELTTAWTVGGGFEYFWTRNFSSTIYGGYTRRRVQQHRGHQPLVLRWRQRASPQAARVQRRRPAIRATACGRSARITTGSRCLGSGLRSTCCTPRVDTDIRGQTVTLSRGTGTRVGARPTGVYTVKDLGIVSVMFRAQRTWGGN